MMFSAGGADDEASAVADAHNGTGKIGEADDVVAHGASLLAERSTFDFFSFIVIADHCAQKMRRATARSMQAGAALAPGISQQAFKHATGIWVAGVIAAHVTPSGEIPIGRAGFDDEFRKAYGLGRPVGVKREREVHPRLRHCHCR